MDKKYCTFAGHSIISDDIEDCLFQAVCDLIENKSVTAFYVGNHGNFDGMSAGAVRRAKRKYNDKNIKLILVYPKLNTTLSNNKEYYEDMYDDVLIPAESDAAHYKAMITVRNRWMVDNSDYIITYIRREHGGAYTTYKYAKRKDIEIIEL